MATNVAGHGPAQDHTHDVSIEDTFDFLNTLSSAADAPVDRIPTLEAAVDWLVGHGVVHAGDAIAPAASDRERRRAITRLRAVRGALREVSDAVVDGRPADRAALAEVNRALRARERVELVPAADGVSVGHSHVGDALDDALSRLAEPLVLEISMGRADRLRICADDTCRWVFYDESRAGRRRWCDMATCGNRAKAARHRARQRTAESGGARVTGALPGD